MRPADDEGLDPAPDLIFEYPDCTVCENGGNVASDGDSYYCQECGTAWDRSGSNGERQ